MRNTSAQKKKKNREKKKAFQEPLKVILLRKYMAVLTRLPFNTSYGCTQIESRMQIPVPKMFLEPTAYLSLKHVKRYGR